MTELPCYIRVQGAGASLAVKVQPRASRNEIVGELGGALKIKLTAPPVDSAANEALVVFLAEKVGCAKSAVTLARGQRSRHKTVLIDGIDARRVAEKLAPGK